MVTKPLDTQEGFIKNLCSFEGKAGLLGQDNIHSILEVATLIFRSIAQNRRSSRAKFRDQTSRINWPSASCTDSAFRSHNIETVCKYKQHCKNTQKICFTKLINIK